MPWKQKKVTRSKRIDRDILLSISADDQFEKIVISLLPKIMPEYLLEEFKGYIQEGSNYDNVHLAPEGNKLTARRLALFIEQELNK